MNCSNIFPDVKPFNNFNPSWNSCNKSNLLTVLQKYTFLLIYLFNCILGLGVHVKNMQDSCIGTHVAAWFAAFLPSPTFGISPHAISPQLHTPCCPSRFPPTDPSVWCSPPCVHVFSLFKTCLWVRTCGVWFSVLVSVCWEWWSPGSSMSLQRKWTHSFWWLHNIPWCICATFSLSSLSSMGIWVVSLCYSSKSLLL